MLRTVEIESLRRQTTVDAAVSAFARDGDVLQDVRASGAVGMSGGQNAPAQRVPIDPTTGLPTIDPNTLGVFLSGDVVGVKGVG